MLELTKGGLRIRCLERLVKGHCCFTRQWSRLGRGLISVLLAQHVVLDMPLELFKKLATLLFVDLYSDDYGRRASVPIVVQNAQL